MPQLLHLCQSHGFYVWSGIPQQFVLRVELVTCLLASQHCILRLMFAHFELPEEFYVNDTVIRDCVQSMNIKFDQDTRTLKPNTETNIDILLPDAFCQVVDGIVKVYGNGRLLYFLETGDVFLSSSLQAAHCTLLSEFPSVIQSKSLQTIQDEYGATQDFLSNFDTIKQTLAAQLHILLQATSPPEIDIQPETRTYSPGDVVIIQETSPQEVFTLLSGDADVYMGDKKVGEILVGEIFGAMAVTGNIPRSASVIARTHCVALALPKENFLGLARTHPETLFKLIDTMSRIILDLNEQLKNPE